MQVKAARKKKAKKKTPTTRVSRISKTNGGFRVLLSDSLGYVNVVKTMHGFWETHSWIDPKIRGRGFGIQVYSKAIAYCLKRGYTLKSSWEPSNDAIRVWQSKRLRTKYRIHKRGNRFCVIGVR